MGIRQFFRVRRHLCHFHAGVRFKMSICYSELRALSPSTSTQAPPEITISESPLSLIYARTSSSSVPGCSQTAGMDSSLTCFRMPNVTCGKVGNKLRSILTFAPWAASRWRCSCLWDLVDRLPKRLSSRLQARSLSVQPSETSYTMSNDAPDG